MNAPAPEKGPDTSAGQQEPRAPAPEPFDHDRVEIQAEYVVVYGEDGTVLYVNPAMVRALGYPAKRLVGSPLHSFIAEESRSAVEANIAAQKDAGDIPLFEAALVTSGGSPRSVIVKGKRVLYRGTPAMLLFLIDITQRKALEDQLAARAAELLEISNAYRLVNRKLTLLSTITRHDINNQLTVVKGYLGILEAGLSDPDLALYCKKALASADRIIAMIQFTGEYEKIGITAPKWQGCRGVVAEAVSQAPLGMVVVVNDLPGSVEVFSDPLIVKVFYNLMDNAVRYGGKITTIRFTFAERDGNAVIICEDDGEGIPATDKERIFERGVGKNTGLGLALSREILDITGISLHERGEPGRGARFEMTVPAAAWRRTGA